MYECAELSLHSNAEQLLLYKTNFINLFMHLYCDVFQYKKNIPMNIVILILTIFQTIPHPAQPTVNFRLYSPVLSITLSALSTLFYHFPLWQHDGVGMSMERYDSWIVGCHID